MSVLDAQLLEGASWLRKRIETPAGTLRASAPPAYPVRIDRSDGQRRRKDVVVVHASQ